MRHYWPSAVAALAWKTAAKTLEGSGYPTGNRVISDREGELLAQTPFRAGPKSGTAADIPGHKAHFRGNLLPPMPARPE